ncbi:hypothetical protein J6590_066363 [Homalodisca vitripennis]|nr:hypothetical protein J6590_066363 [Homalodisca vitripennis]
MVANGMPDQNQLGENKNTVVSILRWRTAQQKQNKHLVKQNIKLELLLTSTPRLGVSTTLPERPTPSKGQWALQPINHTHTLYKTHMSRGDIGIEPAQTPPQKEELPSVNFFKMKNQTKCLSPQWLKNYKPETLKSAEGKTKKIQLEARNHSKSCVGTKKKTGTLIRKKEQR